MSISDLRISPTVCCQNSPQHVNVCFLLEKRMFWKSSSQIFLNFFFEWWMKWFVFLLNLFIVICIHNPFVNWTTQYWPKTTLFVCLFICLFVYWVSIFKCALLQKKKEKRILHFYLQFLPLSCSGIPFLSKRCNEFESFIIHIPYLCFFFLDQIRSVT